MKMSFTIDFPRPTGEAYTSLEEAKDSERYKCFVALVKRMNKYRREARTAFADPAKANIAQSLAAVFEPIGEVLGGVEQKQDL